MIIDLYQKNEYQINSMKLHHIGIVVSDISKYQNQMIKLLKPKETDIPKENKLQKIKYLFINVGGSNIELIEPLENDSPVTSFLEKGGGLHHLAFEVDDIEQSILEFEKNGGRVLNTPQVGFENRLISFIFQNSFPFKIIELVSKKPDDT
jgi:methylmalonyl-CoA/ethylmalonyl-CoA epimerase